MNNKEIVYKYADKLRDLDTNLGDDARIQFKDDDRIYELRLSDDSFIDITSSEEVIKLALEESFFNYFVVAYSEFAGISSSKRKSIPSVLDDAGMIIGLKTPFVRTNTKSIIKALRRSRACLLTDGSLLCGGTDMYEAYTCFTIASKNAEIYHKAKVLGGAKPINLINGILENRDYIKSYSKLERSKK